MEIPSRFEQQLWEALQSAIPSIEDLTIMVRFGLDENLEHITDPGRPPSVILKLISWASSRSRFEDLVAAAQKHNPTNDDLAAFVERFNNWKASQERQGDEPAEAEEAIIALTPPPGSVGEFTDYATWSPFVSPKSVHSWSTAMQKAGRAICRIETLAGIRSYGTGFLIGPRLVLTAEYVVPDGNVELRFDYEFEADNLTPRQGTVHKLAKHWLVEKEDELYALILAEGVPGDDSVNGPGKRRGWLRMAPDYQLKKGEPIFIIGHYDSKPFTVSHYYALSDNQGDGPYFDYRAYHPLGSPGLAGAPIFNSHWEVIGIHSKFNPLEKKRSGIAIKYILEQPAVQLALAISGH